MAIVLVAAALCGAAFCANPKDPLKRPANHRGIVFMGEWHHVEPGRGPMFRTPRQFLADLARLDRMGFRPVTARDWLTGRMCLPKGASPVVMTFDDSFQDQFRLLENGAVDLWQNFAKKHPEFPVKVTFFAVPTVMWSQPKWTPRKLKLLRA